MTKDQIMQILRGTVTTDLPVAGEIIGVSRGSAYLGAKRGQIPTIEVGGRKKVPTSWLLKKLGLNEEAA